MKIIKIDVYMDGGTIKIITTDEIYYIDGRINTKTRGCVFCKYPKDNSDMCSNQDKIISEIINSLNYYSDPDFARFDWKPGILKLLNI
jgi:hypothetical protein